ncbi:DUF4893 domain-containing protein [Paracoccus sp. YIM 132242]|uniref:DUF4893 domain-containing protein n=1 Tax=Paracoccus lichenicola TaxID=2665644 RepID=A0A6L6HMC2_9RHOB|nr:DUF4893 domain-containing protein [Paracoccus lichenicola]MTD99389.1 DUF4893 domain-containing protein [Paracoccus lichenicola]
MTKALALAVALALGLPVAGAAQAIRPDDQARLDQLDAAAGKALLQVLSLGSDEEIVSAINALQGPGMAPNQSLADSLPGDWQCAMVKMGGVMPLVAYPPFRCRIEARDGILHFDKLTGSQRTSGTIQQIGDRWIYLGSSFVGGQQPRPYADFPAEIDTGATETLPDVGVLEVLGQDRARLVMPLPYRESVLNVLVLTR